MIEDLLRDGKFLVAVPIKKGQYISFLKGTELKVSYGLDNRGMFSFKAVVDGKLDRNQDYVVLRKNSEIKSIQRRNYYRLDLVIDVSVKIREKDGTEEMTQTLNLSGGGLKLYMKGNTEKDRILFLTIYLPNRFVETKAKVIQVEIQDEKLKKRRLVSAEFIDIREEDRNEIVRYIFAKERELLKKGM